MYIYIIYSHTLREVHRNEILSLLSLSLSVKLRNHEVGYFDPLLWAVRVTILVGGGQI